MATEANVDTEIGKGSGESKGGGVERGGGKDAGGGESKGGGKVEPDFGARFDALEKENRQLRELAGRSATEAGQARGLVAQLLQKLEQVAAQPNANGDAAKQLREKFDEDPAAAVNDMFNSRVAPILGEYMSNQAVSNREIAKAKLGKAWERYEKEIDEFMDGMPPDVKARPGAWEAAHKYIVAGHIDEEVESRSREARERESRTEGASGAQPPRPMKPVFGDLEKAAMAEFGMNEDEWARYSNIETKPEEKANANK